MLVDVHNTMIENNISSTEVSSSDKKKVKVVEKL